MENENMKTFLTVCIGISVLFCGLLISPSFVHASNLVVPSGNPSHYHLDFPRGSLVECQFYNGTTQMYDLYCDKVLKEWRYQCSLQKHSHLYNLDDRALDNAREARWFSQQSGK